MRRLYVAALAGLLLTATSAAAQSHGASAQPPSPPPIDMPPPPSEVPAPPMPSDVPPPPIPADALPPPVSTDMQSAPGDVPMPADMPPPVPQTLPPEQGPRGVVGFQTFYDELSPYGSWIQTPDYGWVWLPAGEESDWQPYTTGQWMYTSDYGYCWIPDEPWGWATFHYGNWISTPSYGWAWVPGYTWGPGWVDWYYGGGYVGWAPVPAVFYGSGFWGLSYGFAYGPGYYGPGYYGGGAPRHPRVAPDMRNNVRNVIDPNHYVYVSADKIQGRRVTDVMTRASGMNTATFGSMVHVDRVPTNIRSIGQMPGATHQPGQMLGGARVLDDSHPPTPITPSSGTIQAPALANLRGLPPITGSSVVPTQPHPGTLPMSWTGGVPNSIAGHQFSTRPWTQQAAPRFSATPRIVRPNGWSQISRGQMPTARSMPSGATPSHSSGSSIGSSHSSSSGSHSSGGSHIGGGHFGGGHFGGGHHR